MINTIFSNCHHSSHTVTLGSLLSLILIFFLLKEISFSIASFFKHIALLIYSLHAIQSSPFKHTSQRVLVTHGVAHLLLQYNVEACFSTSKPPKNPQSILNEPIFLLYDPGRLFSSLLLNLDTSNEEL